MAKRRKKKSGRVVTVDMTGVESGGVVPEGEWMCTIVEVEVKTGEDSGKKYLAFTGQTEKGKVFWNCSLQPQALFNLRSLLEACEIEVPDSEMELDLDELIDCEFVAVVSTEKREGKLRNKVDAYLSAEDYTPAETEEEDEDEDEDEDEEEDEDEDEEEVKVVGDDLPLITEDELSEMSVKELQAVVEKYELDVNLKKFRSARKKIGAVQDALETAGYLEE